MDNDTIEFENRTYVNPNVSRDEQMGFIDTLRQTQAENTARINQQTRALGSQIDPMYGGFTGGEGGLGVEGASEFEKRYSIPQTESIVAGLKTAAQQTALNQALTNYQNQMQQRYKEAYRNAKIREYNEAKRAAQTPTSPTPTTKGEVEVIPTNPITNDNRNVVTAYLTDPSGTEHIVASDADTGDTITHDYAVNSETINDLHATNPIEAVANWFTGLFNSGR